jgi:predicted dehydrogenase
MEELCATDADIVIVATPDHVHVEQCVMALEAGKHVICEKPLAPTVADCRIIIDAVNRSGKFFMTGQVCRYAPGFRAAKKLYESGRIGDLVYIESEYAHDYDKARGFKNWRMDPEIKREGFLGGGCHALDLVRWIAGNPIEVFSYMNHKILTDWPTCDTGVAVAKFPNDVIGRIFVSTGIKRPYTMRTVLYGTRGTIICDNTSPSIQIAEKDLEDATGKLDFNTIPVNIASHNVASELKDFVEALKENRQCPTDVWQGTRTVAFAEAALRSARSGKPEKVDIL